MATKLVCINLEAVTIVQYSEILAVPDDMTAEELTALVNQRYEEVPAHMYSRTERDMWDRCDSTGFQVMPENCAEAPQEVVVRENGRFALKALLAAKANETWSAVVRLEFLESLGYDIDTDDDQPGLFLWTQQATGDGCELSFSTDVEAIDNAWTHAVGVAMARFNLSSEEWDALSLAQQKVQLAEAFGVSSALAPELNPEQVAREFAEVLKTWLTAEQMETVVARNRAEPNANVCHSHDFVDANMAMSEVFEKHGIDVCSSMETSTPIWNAAWQLAVKNEFWLNGEITAQAAAQG